MASRAEIMAMGRRNDADALRRAARILSSRRPKWGKIAAAAVPLRLRDLANQLDVEASDLESQPGSGATR